jgi:metallopeptidase MepB
MKFWITGKEPDTLPILKSATHTETRKRVFLMTQHRCAENISLYQKILELRDDTTRLLGYANNATFKSYFKIVKTPDVVEKFLNGLEAGLKQQRDEENNTLLKLKQENLSTDEKTSSQHARRLILWDRAYYDRIHKEK